jgi:two-component system, OmpR family, sensor histidine kinase ChvG
VLDFSSLECFITFELETNDSAAIIRITNKGLTMPNDILESLFIGMASNRSSTEGNPHLTIGLYIAHRITRHLAGGLSISNTYDPNAVEVAVRLPIGKHIK